MGRDVDFIFDKSFLFISVYYLKLFPLVCATKSMQCNIFVIKLWMFIYL